MGTGKYYDCVFCKRGFTTAQALGGHMNIHKKDRASKKASLPPSMSIIKVGEKYLNLKPYPSIRNHRSHPHLCSSAAAAAALEIPADRHQDHYLSSPSILIRSSGLLEKLTSYNAHCYKGTDDHQPGCNLLGGDWRPDNSSLLRSEPSHVCASKRKMEASPEENGLDLELRLGPRP